MKNIQQTSYLIVKDLMLSSYDLEQNKDSTLTNSIQNYN